MKFNSLNKSTAKFTYQLPKDTPFKKLSELELDTVYKVHGLWISKKGKFGDHPVIASTEFFIDLPKHLNDDVKQILADSSAIDQINNDQVGITVYEYEKDNKKYRSINWHDLDANGNILDD